LGYVLVLIVIVVGIGLVKAWHARKPAPQLQAPPQDVTPPVTASEPAFPAGQPEAEKSEEGLAPIAPDEPAAVAAGVPEPSLDERLALSN
jgi:hypothetical protein